MSKIAWSVAVVLCVAGLALAGSSAPSPAAQASCVKVFERQRACTDTFIPALVDLRVSLDKPAGIAASVKKDGRDTMISAALEEWKSDSTDAAIAKTCASMPAARATAMSSTEKCLDAANCQAFSECLIPLMRSTMR